MDLLARREHTGRELYEKLSKRGFDPDAIDAVIIELAAANLQSDSRFAESFIQQRIRKGFGEYKIRAGLRDRGVDSSITEDSIAGLSVDWVEIAEKLIRKKFTDKTLKPGSKELLKCRRYLQSRGFSAEQIEAAIPRGGPED